MAEDFAKGRDLRLRPLPAVTTLQEAVEQVINSNQRDGYVPSRFLQATEHGRASNLLAVCERLIQKGETLENLEDALRKFPTLLTLEDFVSRFGDGWGFSRTTVYIAKQRASYFDQLAGDTRYS